MPLKANAERADADLGSESHSSKGRAGSRWQNVSESGEELRFDDFLGFRIGRLNTLIHRDVTAKYLEPNGLSLPEWRVLARIARHSSLEMRELSRINLMDKAAISRAVDSLLAKGYTERHTDPAHAKRRIVAITPAGRRLMRKVLPQAQREQAALLRLMSPDERQVLDVVLARLTHVLLNAHAGSGDGPSE